MVYPAAKTAKAMILNDHRFCDKKRYAKKPKAGKQQPSIFVTIHVGYRPAWVSILPGL